MTAQVAQLPPVQGAAPAVLTPAAADTIPIVSGQQYIVIVNNASGASINVTLVDSNSVSPGGAATFNPNVVVAVPAGAQRAMLLDGTRFRDASGNLNIQFSAFATVTYTVYGPV